ncbi:Uncharacterized protein ECG_02141 [Echinococcus granulosus]|uniref:Stomatin n=1 Tax=Echinococcus granulosus TaxID=6210 RepID=A0A068WTQ0_ECHGR|nr:Uncharacterized protein ECG_02141 [Echinococcus granulosus]CDS21822.1 stomatin [Echinococcus granulosus]
MPVAPKSFALNIPSSIIPHRPKELNYGTKSQQKLLLTFHEMSTGNRALSGVCEHILYFLSYTVFVLFLPVSVFICLKDKNAFSISGSSISEAILLMNLRWLCTGRKVVQEYERAVIFRLGRVMPGSMKGPGIFLCLPCVEECFMVDLRTITFDIPPQEILTKDSVTVSVDAVIYYKVFDAMISVANVENAHHSTRLLAQTTLRNVLGTKRLSEILSERDVISSSMQSVLDDATEAWGIKVERVEIKDVRLPVQLQRAMAAEAEATREARAKVIQAEGERKASRALREASLMLNDKPVALQLRYLQTLSGIAAEHHSTIIFPLPIDLTTSFLMSNPAQSMKSGINGHPTATAATTTTSTATTATTMSSCNNNSSDLNV